jgi:hypothetical protein
MKKKIISSITISLFLLILTITAVSAVTRMPGVEAGNQFVYGILVNWQSNDPNATIPSYLQDLNETQFWMVTITDVLGTNVTGQTVQHFKNGTEQQNNGYADVDTGVGTNLTMWVIAANLNANDSIYTTGYYSNWIINETIFMTYPGGIRETNHFNVTMTYSAGNTTLQQSENIYWDKPTGVVTELSVEFSNQTGLYLTTMNYGVQITASNVWVIPEYPTWIPVLILLITITSITVIRKRKLYQTQTG